MLRLVIKPLGDYTRTLRKALQPGQSLRIEGPYGCFNCEGSPAREQIWVAGGVGITPFLALLEARQPGGVAVHEPAQQKAYMHYCTRNAAQDAVLPRLHMLCAQAHPGVQLQVHDAAQGQYLQPQDLERHGAQLDVWICGPSGLGRAMRRAAKRHPGWHVHQEAFQMR